ncbi:MAG: hypothetical protein KF746_05865 [Chitinophagaceae bacterium]|nr:hypothetical protein [Chitinophagaceae bacterium]
MVTFFRKKVTEKSGGIVVERKTGFVEQQIEVHNQLINSKLDDMSLAGRNPDCVGKAIPLNDNGLSIWDCFSAAADRNDDLFGQP